MARTPNEYGKRSMVIELAYMGYPPEEIRNKVIKRYGFPLTITTVVFWLYQAGILVYK